MKALVLALCFIGLAACSPGKRAQSTHYAEFVLPPREYPALIAAFDAEMATFGLKRYQAGEGLSKVNKREVLFAAYQDKAKSKKSAALDMTDLKQAGHVEIFVYDGYFQDAPMREEFRARVDALIASYGAKLAPR